MKMAIRLLFLLLLTALHLGAVRAEEKYGTFAEYPQGEFILQEPRPVFRLTKDFVFLDENGIEWIAPKGESIDGASIPKPAWSFIGGPFEGRYLYAAIIHDYFSCSKSRDFDETQDIFWRAMRAAEVDGFKAYYMWFAVQFLGLSPWQVDPSQPIAAPCRGPDTETATIFDRMDDNAKKAAQAKLYAVQRTLETSGGEIVDVVGNSVVRAGSLEALSHVQKLRESAEKGILRADSDLGLFTIPSELEAANPGLVSPWSYGDVSALDEYLAINKIPAEYGVIKQPKFDIKEIQILAPRFDVLTTDKYYRMQRFEVPGMDGSSATPILRWQPQERLERAPFSPLEIPGVQKLR
jgi:hypothetical protein